MRYIFLCLILFVFCFFIYKSQYKKIEIKPINLNKNHICESDDMIIINYHGPKAQIIWKDGSRSFYCEVREAFYESLDKVKNKFILAFYVQDFSNLEWGSYEDKWALAENLYYIIDSSKLGAMGLSYVPFSNLENAKKFLNENGGNLLLFNEINENTLIKSAEILEKKQIF